MNKYCFFFLLSANRFSVCVCEYACVEISIATGNKLVKERLGNNKKICDGNDNENEDDANTSMENYYTYTSIYWL